MTERAQYELEVVLREPPSVPGACGREVGRAHVHVTATRGWRIYQQAITDAAKPEERVVYWPPDDYSAEDIKRLQAALDREARKG